ncbi:MAG: methylmalonyl Co-A mutase-associated GTPase MeaB [Bacteroidetes bacterium]|nr:methylmalonyl Co-A mutase-associated GTPase MeaB [Bacteroidota bacterium]
MNYDIPTLAAGVIAGKRRMLAKAISLVESADLRSAFSLVEQILPHTGKSMRIGVTGSPGAGKSSFIEAFGRYIRTTGKKTAVLAIDPSSEISGGSILGDKARMVNLARDEGAFIRPSPSGGTLGGVGRVTRETILLCEAAGYEVVIVETMGVGQAENEVASMTDCVLAMMLPNAGDELQGIKRGSMENADIFIVTKADGATAAAANEAARQIEFSLRFMRWKSSDWKPPVLKVSSHENKAMDEVWKYCTEFFGEAREPDITARRARQNLHWFSVMTRNLIMEEAYKSDEIRSAIAKSNHDIEEGKILPSRAAVDIVRRFFHNAERIQSKV